MSDFKFACSVCGQHISCDTTKAGSQMECPTCFQKLTVPQAPGDESSKFILTASKVQTRPVPYLVIPPEAPKKKEIPYATIALIVVVCLAAAGGIAFRNKIFKHAHKQDSASAGSSTNESESSAESGSSQSSTTGPDQAPPTSTDTNWTLDLASVKIPEAVAMGKINGRDFVCERAVLSGGRLDLRQGPKWPPDLGVSVYLSAARGEDLANKTITVAANTPNAPRVTLRWKDERQEPKTKTIRSGYVLRLEYGKAADKHISGKIYFCTPDSTTSWAAGTFEAEIRVPRP